MSEALAEEYEILESIFPTELSKISDRQLQIDVEPEGIDELEGDDSLRIALQLEYPNDYPDAVPTITLTATEGSLDEREHGNLLSELQKMGEETLGMAMTFTLVSHLRDQLSEIINERTERRQREEAEAERRAIEAEEARTRGTPVTPASFKAWKAKFDQEQAARKAKEDEEKLKGLTLKEREEWKRVVTRLSGRQLFEHNKNLEEDALLEEGTTSVDISQFERSREAEDEDEDERVTFSDSD